MEDLNKFHDLIMGSKPEDAIKLLKAKDEEFIDAYLDAYPQMNDLIAAWLGAKGVEYISTQTFVDAPVPYSITRLWLYRVKFYRARRWLSHFLQRKFRPTYKQQVANVNDKFYSFVKQKQDATYNAQRKWRLR